jgi:hypothetical protein
MTLLVNDTSVRGRHAHRHNMHESESAAPASPRPDHSVMRALHCFADQLPEHAERRLGERSPRPLASLSVTMEIEVAQVRIRTESSVANAREATVAPRQVPPVLRPGHTRLRSCPTWRAVCGRRG